MLGSLALMCVGQTALAPQTDALVQAFESGRMTEVLRLSRQALEASEADSEPRLHAQLIEAFALLRIGRGKDARRALETLAASGPDLGAYLAHLRASVAAGLGLCHEAHDLSDSLPVSSVFAAPSWGQVARCWLRVPELERAQNAARNLAVSAKSDDHQADAMLIEAKLVEARGAARDALELFRTIVVDYPLTSAGEQAEEHLAELRRQGLAVRPLGPEDLLERAEMERSKDRPRQARRIYRSLASPNGRRTPESPRLQAELGLADLDIVDKRYGRALARLNKVLGARDAQSLSAQALYLKGDILARQGRVRDAIDAFVQAARDYPDDPFGVQSTLCAARLCYGQGDHAQARELARAVLSRPNGGSNLLLVDTDGLRQEADAAGSLHDQARWLLAWIERRSGAAAAVVDSYLAEIEDTGALAEAALYWRTRLALDAGDAEAAEIFAALLRQKAPTSYYALAARDRVSRARPGCELEVAVAALSEASSAEERFPAAQPGDLLGAVVLLQHGLKSEARRVLRRLPAPRLSQADRLVAAWIYRRCGDVHRASVLTRRMTQKNSEALSDPVLIDLAYPRPFSDLVEQAAADYGVAAALIYAVMREESAFDPGAVSPRYARGLMQMTRPTALRMARDGDFGRFRVRQLFDPAVAIGLGTQYLATLLERFSGNLAAVAASYHAGESSVERWLRTRSDLDMDEFVEDIPLAGTRRYVKKVLASYGIYRLLADASGENDVRSETTK